MSKSITDWCKKIEIWWLLRDIRRRGDGYQQVISWGDKGAQGSITVQVSVFDEEKYVRFMYSQTNNFTDAKTDFDYKIPIVETPCHFGGTRYWFTCPLQKDGKLCGRRIGVIYLGGHYFGCRQCNNLAYLSQRTSRGQKDYGGHYLTDVLMKTEQLQAQIKRHTWRGVATRKEKRLQRLREKTLPAVLNSLGSA